MSEKRWCEDFRLKRVRATGVGLRMERRPPRTFNVESLIFEVKFLVCDFLPAPRSVAGFGGALRRGILAWRAGRESLRRHQFAQDIHALTVASNAAFDPASSPTLYANPPAGKFARVLSEW